VRVLAVAAFGQSAAPHPAFEAASFKKGSCEQRPVEDAKGDHIILRNLPMLIFVRVAYDVPFDRVQGPAWLNVECCDLVAKLSPDCTRPMLGRVLQNLLVERVKLQAQTDETRAPVYALVVGKQAPLLKESSPGGQFRPRCEIQGRNRTCTCQHTTMTRDYFDLPVVDLTGLTAAYASP
jgi:uncharacterized protein (TIGR03435 family)